MEIRVAPRGNNTERWRPARVGFILCLQAINNIPLFIFTVEFDLFSNEADEFIGIKIIM